MVSGSGGAFKAPARTLAYDTAGGSAMEAALVGPTSVVAVAGVAVVGVVAKVALIS